MSTQKPVVYLDIDDTLVRFPHDKDKAWWLAHPDGELATDAVIVLQEMTALCEVRWLTAWCPSGSMRTEGYARLAALGIPTELIEDISNPLPWSLRKPMAIDWDEHRAGRRWVWIEDELPPEELRELNDRRARHCYIRTESSQNPDALRNSWHIAKRRLGLSVSPSSSPATPPETNHTETR